MDSFNGYWMNESASMWIHRLDIYFTEEFNCITDSEKVIQCQFYLEGEALQWYKGLHVQGISWNKFMYLFKEQFFNESPMDYSARLFQYNHYPNMCFDYYYTLVKYLWQNSSIPFNFPDFYFHIVQRCSEPELKIYLTQFSPRTQEELDEIYVAYADNRKRYHVVMTKSDSDNVNRSHYLSMGVGKTQDNAPEVKSTANTYTCTITKKISLKNGNGDRKSKKRKFASKFIGQIKLSEREKIIRSHHERDRNASVSCLAKQISKFYYWPHIHRSIKRLLRRLNSSPFAQNGSLENRQKYNEDVVVLERGRTAT
jgi:hypothetical protein